MKIAIEIDDKVVEQFAKENDINIDVLKSMVYTYFSLYRSEAIFRSTCLKIVNETISQGKISL